jgi:tetratricopeptide (TPR) repeat protein
MALGTERPEEAISECDTAIRLSPRDPVIYAFFGARAGARFSLGDYEAAVKDARRAIRHPAATFHPHATLAAALALLDRPEEAKIALDKLLELKPDYSPYAVLAAFPPLNPEAALRPVAKIWIDGLRKAGLDIPDEPPAAD